MPGKQIVASGGPLLLPDLSLLRAHKALPKRRVLSPDVDSTVIATPRAREYDLEREGYSSSERIRSWIPKPSSVQPILDHELPLTPPLNPSEETDGVKEMDNPPDGANLPYASSHTASSGITTPVLKRSPPTPETTPPRLYQHTHTTRESPNPRLPSTRAESFETARENLTTDEESSQPASPTLCPSRQKWLRSAGHANTKSVGLGLGLESEDGERTPTELAPFTPAKEEELISFEGAWNGATPEINAVKGGADLAYQAEINKRLRKRSRISEQILENPLTNGRSSPSSMTRSLTLRERISHSRQTPPRVSTEDFVEKTQWPLQDEDLDLEQKLREMDNRRLSQISTTSTTVEAVIFSTPPKRRRTLRHSSKFTDLNSANLQSERKLSGVNHPSYRRTLRHRTEGQRASSALVTPRDDRALYPSGKQDILPVIVTPNRISSLGSKLSCVPSLTTEQPLTSVWQQSSRPTTAPEDAVGYFDVPQPKRRVVSSYTPVSPPKEEKSRAKQSQPATVPTNLLRSAEGTKRVSRETSSGSAGNDSVSPPTRQQSQTGYHFPEAIASGIASPDEGSNGDWSALRPRSSLVTPFSLRSARSSTPGTEVNEATAISIYPHTNKSILVVQHAPRRNSQPAEHSAIIASNAKFAIPAGSVQPPFIHEPRRLLNSPLQNPRSPPQPPDFKIIPPTPANVTDVSSPDRQQPPPFEQAPKRRLSTRMKRAFSTKRYSDAVVSPITRSFSLSRRNTVTGARRASTGIDLERNLHPLWRPRAFWEKDDRSDSDSDFGNDGFLVGNSLGMPAGGVKTFDSPRRRGSLSHRLGSLRLPRRRRTGFAAPTSHPDELYYDDDDDDEILPDPTPVRRHSSARGLGLRHTATMFYRRGRSDNSSYEFLPPPHARENGGAGGADGVPRHGYQVQFVGFKGLAEKVKERREEAKREKMRERLRGSIDVLRGV